MGKQHGIWNVLSHTKIHSLLMYLAASVLNNLHLSLAGDPLAYGLPTHHKYTAKGLKVG